MFIAQFSNIYTLLCNVFYSLSYPFSVQFSTSLLSTLFSVRFPPCSVKLSAHYSVLLLFSALFYLYSASFLIIVLLNFQPGFCLVSCQFFASFLPFYFLTCFCHCFLPCFNPFFNSTLCPALLLVIRFAAIFLNQFFITFSFLPVLCFLSFSTLLFVLFFVTILERQFENRH